jgi:extradiol dioxygenase family protein
MVTKQATKRVSAKKSAKKTPTKTAKKGAKKGAKKAGRKTLPARKPAAKAVASPAAGAAPAKGPVRLRKVGLVILYVKNPVGSAVFYREVLGMKVLEETPEWVELDAGGMHLALHVHPSIPVDRGDASSWVVFQVDDVMGTHRALSDRGVQFMSEPKQVCGDDQKAGMSSDFTDPDGNRLSIFGFVSRG